MDRPIEQESKDLVICYGRYFSVTAEECIKCTSAKECEAKMNKKRKKIKY